jgi:glutamate synthase domain-containing protein 3
MSGGIAYCLMMTGEFAKTRCNRPADLEKVDIPEDVESLRYWIARHVEETGSPRANWVLTTSKSFGPSS